MLAAVGYTLATGSRIEFLTAASATGLALAGNEFANTITSGSGADLLSGGGGVDTFRFLSLADPGSVADHPDTVLDFDEAAGEKIDVASLDASSIASGNQAFTFLGSAPFSGVAGQLRFAIADGNTTVLGDTNGDGNAEFAVLLNGAHILGAGNFVL